MTGVPTVLYALRGRVVAWGDSAVLRYVLANHLASTHREVAEDQAEVCQRRYYPFGSDRPVSGANDLALEERFTGQLGVQSGSGNPRRELYYYDARW